MILSGLKIEEEVKKGNIDIFPFSKENINPNSYNYSLGEYLEVYEEEILDPKKEMRTQKVYIPDDGMILYPNKLYLGYTQERFGSDKFVPCITGRSSTGRIGLFVQITSDLVDIGFHGNLTLQLHATQPVKVYKGMKIGQVTFWDVLGDVELYHGKYQGSIGPMKTKIYKEFN